MASADLSLVQQWVGLEVSRELYDQVRSLWAHHCERENNGDVDGILTTLTEDCEYHVVNIGKRWRGHAGAREFYRELLAAFTDVLWVPEVFPWDTARSKFSGERIYLQPVTPESALLPDELAKTGAADAILRRLAQTKG